MTGTLELLCGPSGVGKTSKIDKKERSFTYTTRRPREREKEGADRNFVDETLFQRLVDNNEIIFSYEYAGNRYGFSKNIIEELQQGRSVSEQIVPCEQAIRAGELFQRYGNVVKRLFLCSMDDIYIRLQERDSPSEFDIRVKLSLEETKKYLDNIRNFDFVHYNFPTKLVESHSQRLFNALKSFSKKYDAKNIAYTHGQMLLEDPYSRSLYTINPLLYNQVINTAIKLLEGEEFQSKNVVIGRGFENNVFHDIIGISTLEIELNRADKAIGELYARNYTLLNNSFSDLLKQNDPVIKSTVANILNRYHPLNFNYGLPQLFQQHPELDKRVLDALLFLPLLNDIHTYNIYCDYILNVTQTVTNSKMEGPVLISELSSLLLQSTYHEELCKYANRDLQSLTAINKNAVNSITSITNSGKLKPVVALKDEKEVTNYLIESFNASINLATTISHFLWNYSVAYPDVKRQDQIIKTITQNTLKMKDSYETLALKYLFYNTKELLHSATLIADLHMRKSDSNNKFLYFSSTPDTSTLKEMIDMYIKHVPNISESAKSISEIMRFREENQLS